MRSPWVLTTGGGELGRGRLQLFRLGLEICHGHTKDFQKPSRFISHRNLLSQLFRRPSFECIPFGSSPTLGLYFPGVRGSIDGGSLSGRACRAPGRLARPARRSFMCAVALAPRGAETGRCLSVADYVTGIEARDRATAAGWR